jgi:hypothetical protein
MAKTQDKADAPQDKADETAAGSARPDEVRAEGASAPPPGAPPPADGPGWPAPAIAVSTAAPGGRRRAGFAFGPEPTILPIAELSPGQVEAIAADPMLSVRPAD